MPEDHENDSLPQTTSDWILYLAVIGVFLAFFIIECAVNYEPRKLSMLFITLSWTPLLILHEGGHALVSRCFNIRIEEIVIGFGRDIKVFQLGSSQVRFRLYPISGYVRLEQQTKIARLPHALIYLAGPGIELLLALGIWWVLGEQSLMFGKIQEPGIILAQSVLIAAVFNAGFNLIPFSSSSERGPTPSDGLGILICLFAPLEKPEEEA